MQQPQMSPYPVSDFLQWNGAEQLTLTPKFQRRGDVWGPKAKSYLIDTILRGMPIPPVFLRLVTETQPPRTIREVVDGQQRLRCVLGFLAGSFPILPVHNAEYGGQYFNDLPEDAKTEILTYKFQVNTLVNISDAEVLNIFARLNTNTQPLKAQELLNSQFFGAFKQAIYDLSLKYYTFWTSNRIFTDLKIARMAEAEFTSELVINMVSGIRQTKAAQIRSYYRDFDDAFPQSGRVKERFDRVINIISEGFADELPRSPFRRLPLFFSLFLAVYDRQFGLPGTDQANLAPVRPALLGRNLRALQAEMVDPLPQSPVAKFVADSAKATSDPGKRRDRHAFLMGRLFGR